MIKAATSYVSGEMHDTAELGPLEGILFGKENSAFYRLNRRKLFRTCVGDSGLVRSIHPDPIRSDRLTMQCNAIQHNARTAGAP